MRWRTLCVALLVLLAMLLTAGFASLPGNKPAGQDDLRRPINWRPTPTGLYEGQTRMPRPAETARPESTRSEEKNEPAPSTPTLTSMPTPTLTPENSSETPQAAAATGWLAGYEQFASYRLVSTLSWELDNGGRGTTDILTEVVNSSPPAQRWMITSQPWGAAPSTIVVTHVDNQTYMQIDGTLQPVPANLVLLLQRVRWAANAQVFLDLNAGRLVGTEMIDGKEVDHYRYGYQAFQPALAHLSVDNGQADLWFSKEYNAYVLGKMRLVGSDRAGFSGVLSLESYLAETNMPISIQAPVATSPMQPANLPIDQALGLQAFSSYRALNTLRWTLSDGTAGSADTEAIIVRDQPAEYAILRLHQGSTDREVEYLNIDGQVFLRQDGVWTAATPESITTLVPELQWLGEPQKVTAAGTAKLVGFEMVDGMMTYRYRYGREAFQSVPLLANLGDGQVDVWVWNRPSDQEIYLKVALDAGISNTSDLSGTLSMTSSIVDVDAPLVIQRPEELRFP